jgi:glucose-6-phosphate dehydrogenase assembly protein OpcA
MLALWDTTGTEVVRKLAAERHSAGGVASGLALTLVVVVDEARVRAVEDAVTIAAASHPCRLIVVSRIAAVPDGGAVSGGGPNGETKDRLDAEIIVGGRLGPAEAVVLRMHGGVAAHAESVVNPLLAPDVPVVTWWHGVPPQRIESDPLGVVAERRITDVAQSKDPFAGLLQRAEDYSPGDTDLAWTRTTPWRTLIAGAFDTASEVTVRAFSVQAPSDDPVAVLLAGWLSARLGLPSEIVPSEKPHLEKVTLSLSDGTQMSLTRRGSTAVLSWTGHADRILPLVPRRLGEELAEELHRLDADQPYGQALSVAMGISGLERRPAARSLRTSTQKAVS